MNRVIVAALILALASCVSGVAYGTDNVHEHLSRVLPAAGARAIVVDNVSGPVTISTANSNNVTIDAVKSADSTDAIARTHVDIARSGDRLTVQTRYDEGGLFSSHNGASVAYVIRVPALFDVNVHNVSGAITTGGTTGNVTLDDVSGAVRATLGRVSAGRRVRISSVSGAIDVAIARNSDVRVQGRTVSGPITTFFNANIHKGFVGESLDGQLGNASAAMSLSTVSGRITVTQQ